MSGADLTDKVVAFTDKNALFSAPCHVVVGVSGGADSVTLLHLLTRWPYAGLRITAVHIHHGLRGESADRDAAFTESLCADWGIPLVSVRADVAGLARDAGIGLEEAGRRERYRLFEKIRGEIGADYILTAHTASDQAETVLMRLLRGCGTDGLVGIPVTRGVIRRPLLCCSRDEIEAYCRLHSLSYVTDETNTDPHYTRNRIRHELLPLLRQINPSADAALCRLSTHVAEDSRFLRLLAEDALSAATLPDGGYAVTIFADQAQPVRRRMISAVLSALSLSQISEPHILSVEHLLMQGKGDVSLPDGITLRVERGRLFRHTPPDVAEQALDVKALPFTFSWQGKTYTLRLIEAEDLSEWKNVHKMFFKSSIDYARIQNGLCIRSRKTGDELHPAGRSVGKTLKKLMNEWKIPAAQRDTFPLLCDSTGVLLVPGITCDERVRVTADTKHFLVWETASEQG